MVHAVKAEDLVRFQKGCSQRFCKLKASVPKHRSKAHSDRYSIRNPSNRIQQFDGLCVGRFSRTPQSPEKQWVEYPYAEISGYGAMKIPSMTSLIEANGCFG